MDASVVGVHRGGCIQVVNGSILRSMSFGVFGFGRGGALDVGCISV